VLDAHSFFRVLCASVFRFVWGKTDKNNDLANAMLGAATEVHERLGPGLLEAAYRVCLADELRQRAFDAGVNRIVNGYGR
jgi:hypothetical protein